MPSLPEIERALRERLDALGPAPRAELLHVLMLPGCERADRIGEFWGHSESRRIRRASDRLRGGPDAPGGAHRHAAGERAAPLRRARTRATRRAPPPIEPKGAAGEGRPLGVNRI